MNALSLREVGRAVSNVYLVFAFCLQSVHSATRRTLLKIKGFSEIKVDKIKEAIQKCQVRDSLRG
jgi:hypothetical protein